MITKNQIDVLTTSKFDLLKSKDIFKNNLEELKRTIEADLTDLASLALPETVQNRFDFFQVQGAIAEDYSERILEIEKGKFILAGIRFRGLNVNRPFISINPGFHITDNDLPSIAKVIRTEFKVFAPGSFQFPMIPEQTFKCSNLAIDRYTIVGDIDDLIHYELHPIGQQIELEEITDDYFYKNYLNEYQIFHGKNLTLIDEVKPESLEDLLKSMEHKLLFRILVDGNVAGIVAGSPYDYYGQKGVCIIEEILFDSFKGKGLGVHVQREFTKTLVNRYKLLWGTISDLNQSSLKTALRNGRRIEEIEYLYKL